MLINIYNLKSKKFDEIKQTFFELEKIKTDFVLSPDVKSDVVFWDAITSIANFIRFISDNPAKENWTLELNILSLFDVGLARFFVDDFNKHQISDKNISEEFPDLSLQVNVLSAFTDLSFGADFYTTEEWAEILKGKISDPDVDFKKLFATLLEVSKISDQSYDLHLRAVNFLDSFQDKIATPIDWKYSVLINFLLNFLYNRFDKLSETDRKLLLEKYFYAAIILGVPVRATIQKRLREFQWVVPYVDFSFELSGYLEANKEILSIKPAEGLEISEKLKSSSLIDWLKEGDSFLNYENREDLLRLYAYFAFGGNFDKIVEYYSQSPKIPLKIFLQNLSVVADLKDNNTVQLCLNLAEVLKRQNLLPADNDIIEFHESDNQFHWNEKILS